MSDYNEITATITTEEPAVAATLDELRYLVFQGKKGDTGDSAYEEAVKLGFVGTEAEWLASLKGATGERGPAATVKAYLDDGVVRFIESYDGYATDDVYTAIAMQQHINNGALPFVCYSPVDDDFVYFELDALHVHATNPIVYFRSKEYLLTVDATGRYTLANRPQGSGLSDAVLYTEQELTDAQKAQARGNIGAGTYTKPSGGIPASDLASGVQTSLDKADTALQTAPVTSVNNKTGAVTLSASDVGALPSSTSIPTKTSDLTNDSNFQTAAQVQSAIAAIPDELPAVTASDNGKILAVDNGEWSADSPVIVSGTDAQVTNAVNDYLTQYGVPLRLSEEIKQALLDCFENVAWINGQGQTYYDALYAALYPPKTLVSISAAFDQGSAVIYDTDSLDTLKQYLTVTATYDDSSTGVVTNYTLSGTLTEGTSTITVLYNSKTTTFNVTVTEYSPLPSGYTKINGVHGNGSAYVKTNVQVPLGYSVKVKARAYAAPSATANIVGADRTIPSSGSTSYLAFLSLSKTANWLGAWYGSSDNFFSLSNLYDSAVETTTMFDASGSTLSAVNASASNSATVSFSQQNPSTALHLCLFYNGNANAGKFTGDILSVEVLDDSNNTSETFIPAKRDSDNVIGFYAVTEGTFYPSDTSTPFTAVA